MQTPPGSPPKSSLPSINEEEEEETIECSLEGVPYSRNTKGVVYDDDFDPVGEWVDGEIVFDKFGAKVHKKAVAAL